MTYKQMSNYFSQVLNAGHSENKNGVYDSLKYLHVTERALNEYEVPESLYKKFNRNGGDE